MSFPSWYGIYARHNDGANYSFKDGHVEWSNEIHKVAPKFVDTGYIRRDKYWWHNEIDMNVFVQAQYDMDDVPGIP